MKHLESSRTKIMMRGLIICQLYEQTEKQKKHDLEEFLSLFPLDVYLCCWYIILSEVLKASLESFWS